MNNYQQQTKILIFDGVCLLCNSAIYFLHKRVRFRNYKFIASQTDEGIKQIQKYKLGDLHNKTIILIKEGKIYTKSEAIFEILNDMPYKWSIFKIFKVFPKFISDYIYDFISKHRHLFFGKVKRKYEE